MNLKIMAPSVFIPLLFAACMCIVMGIRSSLHIPRHHITLLARKLWQPVSVREFLRVWREFIIILHYFSHGRDSYCFGVTGLYPSALQSSGWAVAVSVTNG